MMSAKLATLGLLKIKVFGNKSYDFIISVHDITNKIMLGASNYIVDVVMWPKFGNSSISMREVIMNSILKGFYQKNHFFEGSSLFKFNSLVLTLGIFLKCHISVAKGLQLKVKVLGANSYVCRSYRGRTGREAFLGPPFLIGLKLGLIFFLFC